MQSNLKFAKAKLPKIILGIYSYKLFYIIQLCLFAKCIYLNYSSCSYANINTRVHFCYEQLTYFEIYILEHVFYSNKHVHVWKKHLTVAKTGHVFLPYMAYECITNLTNKIKNKYIHIIKMYTHFCWIENKKIRSHPSMPHTRTHIPTLFIYVNNTITTIMMLFSRSVLSLICLL